jgi:hypothetical protein
MSAPNPNYILSCFLLPTAEDPAGLQIQLNAKEQMPGEYYQMLGVNSYKADKNDYNDGLYMVMTLRTIRGNFQN